MKLGGFDFKGEPGQIYVNGKPVQHEDYLTALAKAKEREVKRSLRWRRLNQSAIWEVAFVLLMVYIRFYDPNLARVRVLIGWLIGK